MDPLVLERFETLLQPFLHPGSRTFWGALAGSLVIALVVEGRRRGLVAAVRAGTSWSLWGHRSSRLDVQLLAARQALALLLSAPSLGLAWVIATHGVRRLDAVFGMPVAPAWSTASVAVLFSVALFVAWDFSRYLLHRLMHAIPALWSFHQVHHSAEVLTPLTVHRLHPVESVLYQLRGGVTTGVVTAAFYWVFRDQAVTFTLFGAHAAGVVLNTVLGNLRHSHVWLPLGPLERVLLSPAQHQLHHSTDPADFDCNYGVWLALWDRLGGSWKPATVPPPGFGLATRNHGDDLLSAWFAPFRDLLPGRAVAVLLLATGIARADEPDEDEDEDADLEILVDSEGGVPRAAGSAHVVSEEELEVFEFDDIHSVLSRVPGVYLRHEDGFGLRPNIGIRGANSDRSSKITLLEDGIPLVPAPYAAPAAYYFPITTRLTGIEVFKGPAATRHGPHTVGGAINLRTRDTPDDGAAGMIDASLGLRRTFKLHGWGGAGGDRWGVLAEIVHLGSGGFKVLDGGGPTGFDRTEGMLKLRLGDAPDKRSRHQAELKLGYTRERSNETYLGLSPGDYAIDPYRRYAASSEALMQWNRTQVELAWTARLGPNVDIRTVGYHHWLTRAWTKLNRLAGGPDLHGLLQRDELFGQDAVFFDVLRGLQDTVSPDQNVQIGTNDRTFHSFGIDSRLHWRVAKGQVLSQLEVGVRLHGDLVRRLHTEDPHRMTSGALIPTDDPDLVLLDSNSSAQALALHAHEDLGIGPVRLLPGIRMEVIRGTRIDSGEAFDPTTRVIALPGFGIHGSATPWLSVFGGVHRGFSPVAPGQPADVQPETTWSYEAGARVNHGGTTGELVGYLNDYVNLTGQCTISGGCDGDLIDLQFNGGKVWVYGLEAAVGQAVRLPAQWGLQLDGNYTLSESRFRTGFVSGFPQFGTVDIGDRLPYVPVHQGSASVAMVHPRFSLAVGATARSGMRDAAGQGPLTDVDVPPLFLMDIAAHVQVSKWVEGYATVTNATNSRAQVSWRPFGARPVAPLQLQFGVKVRPAAVAR
jgi:Fe(3+) dicitrate transport protein